VLVAPLSDEANRPIVLLYHQTAVYQFTRLMFDDSFLFQF